MTRSLPVAATSTSRPLMETTRGLLALPMSVPATLRATPSAADGLDLDQLVVVGLARRLHDLAAHAEALEEDRGVHEVDVVAADAPQPSAQDRRG